MNLKISAVFFAGILAALGMFAPASQQNAVEAARLNNLGSAYMNQQLFEKGLKAFQQAAEADPKLVIARLNVGIAYLNLQKVDQAKAEFEDTLKLDPKNPNAWYGLGMLAKNMGDAPAAIDAFKHVIEIDPNDADTWYFLGTAYVQAKQFPQAIEAFEHALKINPLHASVEFGLSRAYQQSGDVDHAREHLKKFQYITQNKLGAPMSLAYGEQGKYSRALESPLAVLKAPAQIKVRFVDVTAKAGIVTKGNGADEKGTTGSLGSGACFLDYDGDGRPDVFLPDNGPEGGMALFHNLGNGKVEDVTKKAGLDPTIHAVSCTSGDYDNDGFADLAVSLENGMMLLHNEKNGTFKDVGAAAGIRGLEITGLTFVDYDHDGDLDLYGSSGILVDSSGTSVMWRNNGNGTFTNVTGAIGLSNASSVSIGTDYNNDRAVDLVVADSSGGTVFQNPREGKFLALHPFSEGADSHHTPRDPRAKTAIVMGVGVLDFDHDGWMDVALTYRNDPVANVAMSYRSDPVLVLWRNNHGKSFEPVDLPRTNWVRAFGVVAFDYDNDGWVDLVAVGETKDGKGEVRLFRNLGADGFKDVTADVGLDKIQLKEPR